MSFVMETIIELLQSDYNICSKQSKVSYSDIGGHRRTLCAIPCYFCYLLFYILMSIFCYTFMSFTRTGPPLDDQDIAKLVQHINVYCGDDDLYGFV
jgi:hypothetical protein